VQENIAEMEPGWIRIPERVIQHVGQILDRPVVTRERVEKEIVPERFQCEERALYEWIVSGEVNVIPDELSLDRG